MGEAPLRKDGANASGRRAPEADGKAWPQPEADDARPPAGKHAEASEQARGEGQKKSGGIGGVVRAHPVAVIAAVVVLLIGLIAGWLWWAQARHFESTDDAFIDARQFSISPKVAGYLATVDVTDNQFVAAGAVLFRIDDRDYRVALDQAKAQVAQAQASVQNADAQISAQEAQAQAAQDQLHNYEAALTFATQENGRAQQLVKNGNATLQRAQQTGSQLAQAQATVSGGRATYNTALKQVAALKAQKVSAIANVAAAKAQEAQAELNLGYTQITAAQAGRITRLTAAKGQYVQTGQSLTYFVPRPIWITANFKETQITDMRPGQPVDVEIDAYPARTFHGHVDSIQTGSGTAFSLLPAENATGNYVKVVQRVPVKITLDDAPQDVALGPGMSVIPKVRVR